MDPRAGHREPVVDRAEGPQHPALDAGLLRHLAHGGLLEGLAQFDGAPGQAPLAGQWWLPSSHQQHTPFLHDNGTDTHERPIRIFPLNGYGFWIRPGAGIRRVDLGPWNSGVLGPF